MKVELMCHSGDDLLVVNAARASFGKESTLERTFHPVTEMGTDGTRVGYWTDELRKKDKKLISYLAREKHVLPFRHPQITLRIRVPIFLARQIGKHQVGMSWSEESRRYITTEPEFFWPDKWRKAAENVKQGSSDEPVPMYIETEATHGVDRGADDIAFPVVDGCLIAYNRLLAGGVAPEQARMILPQNMYITAVWTGSLLSFYQMYKLRAEATAQKEARDFAEMVKEVIYPLYPESWSALEEHV